MDREKIIRDQYWSRADAFLLPVTGLKNAKYELKSYLFWNSYGIENNQLILCFTYPDYDEFLAYLRKSVFPKLDKNGQLLEIYDLPKVDSQFRTVLILDISEWQMDINMMLEGKYSKLSQKLKKLVEEFHTDEYGRVDMHIYAAINPKSKSIALLRADNGGKDQTPLEWLAKYMGIDIEEMEKVGEIASKYDKMNETLITDTDFIRQVDNGIAIDESK